MARQILDRIRALEPPSRNVLAGILVFAGAIVVAVWITAVAIAVGERTGVYADAEAELVGGQKAIASHIGRTFEGALAILSAADQWLVDRPADAPRESLATLQSVVERLQLHYERPMPLRVVDRAGNLMPISAGEPDGLSVADRDYFRAIAGQAPGTIHVGAPIESRVMHQQVIPVVLAARPNAFGAAYLIAGIPFDQLIDAYRDLLISAPAISGVIRSDGTFIFRYPDAEKVVGTLDPRFAFDSFFAKNPPAGTITIGGVNAAPRLIAYTRLNALPLAAYSGFSLRDLEARALERTLLPLAVALLASLATIGVTAWLIALVVQRDAEARQVRAALAQAEQANRAKTDFLANMSHELRTPLNAILGFSEMIRGSMAGPIPSKYCDYATDINSSGQHLLGVIEQILDVARIEKGAIEPASEVVDIAHVLGETASMLAPRFAAGHVELVRDLPADLPLLRGDTRMLRQMLLNLLSNAARYAGKGARVTVTASSDGGAITLRVADNGPGIPPETLRHIFEPFGRNHSLVARKDGGLGLGLPITKSLVELHGGSIAIDSARGAGTAVTLRFAADRLVPAAKKSA